MSAAFCGERIRERLRVLEINQSELSRRVGLDSAVISLWAADRRAVPASRLGALALALELSVDELLQGATLLMPLLPRELEIVRALAPRSLEPPPPEAEPEPPSASVFPLLWCNSGHGSGVPRWHHHGPAPSYGPPGDIF